MKIEIKSRWDSSVLFTAEATSLLLALEAAVKRSADLRSANLSGANLSDAYLRSANLSGADLSDANLRSADLRSANLSGADLSDANLRSADLRSANLSGAYLSDPNLSGAYLSDANLSGANLSGANLSGADLSGAYLSGADLSGANLSGADLSGADLRSANLSGANLSGANLSDAENANLAKAQTIITPEGNLVGWKKCRDNIIVKLLIPQKAKRSNATGRKCRAEYATVLRVYQGGKETEVGISKYDEKVEYRKGQEVHCHVWDEDRFNECSGGIHFYLTREEAESN